MATRNAHVLGVTSAWLLVPVAEAAAGRGAAGTAALATWTAVTCAVSLACYPLLGTAAGADALAADKACARVLYAALALRARRGGCAGGFAAPVALAYAASRRAPPGTRAALVAHLVFRYLGYWWVVCALRGRRPPPAEVARRSAAYWAHAALAAGACERGCAPSYAVGCAVALACAAAQ